MDLAALHLLSAASEARERLHVERRLSVSNTEAVDATMIPESPTNANADSANHVAKQGSEVKVDNNEDMEVEIPQTPARLDEDKRSASNSNAGLQLAQSSEKSADTSEQTAMTDENEHQYEPDNANDNEASSDELNDAESVALQNPRTLRKRKRRLAASDSGWLVQAHAMLILSCVLSFQILTSKRTRNHNDSIASTLNKLRSSRRAVKQPEMMLQDPNYR
jgi:hypothetical protein